MIAAPLIPDPLPATPTAYAIAVGTQTAATATARAEKSRQELVVGTMNVESQVFRCPSEEYGTDTLIPAGAVISILGWTTDERGVEWFLVRDDVNQPQQWVRFQNQITLTPTDYKSRLPGATKCRL